MTQFLPPNLLALFAPRDPLPFKQPAEKLITEKKRAPITGIAEYVHLFEDPKDTPAKVKVETKEERRERRRREKAELQAYKIEQGIAMWAPAENTSATSDPYKTMFVGRINFETTESKLRREFETYGTIRKIILVQKKNDGKPRGYAFVEFEKERDMHAAYKHADGKKIDGRRVLVDVERGRAVKGWLPRRLGGGLGNTRRAKTAGADGDHSERRTSREPSAGERGRGGSDRGGSDRGSDRRRSRSPRDRPPPERGGDRERPPPDRGGDRDRSSRDRSDRDRGGDRDRDRATRGTDRDRHAGDSRSARGPPPPSRDDRSRGSRDEKDRGGDRDGGRGRDREPRRERDARDGDAGGNGHNGGGYP